MVASTAPCKMAFVGVSPPRQTCPTYCNFRQRAVSRSSSTIIIIYFSCCSTLSYINFALTKGCYVGFSSLTGIFSIFLRRQNEMYRLKQGREEIQRYLREKKRRTLSTSQRVSCLPIAEPASCDMGLYYLPEVSKTRQYSNPATPIG